MEIKNCGRLQRAMHNMELETIGRPLRTKKIIWQETSTIVINHVFGNYRPFCFLFPKEKTLFVDQFLPLMFELQ